LIKMIEVITRETDKEPRVIVVFVDDSQIPVKEIRYMLTKSGKLSRWNPSTKEKPDPLIKGRWKVIRE